MLLVERVVGQGRPVAHVAKELGVSRQCAHRWIRRYRSEGERWPARPSVSAAAVTDSNRIEVEAQCPADAAGRSVVGQTGSVPSWVSTADGQRDPGAPSRPTPGGLRSAHGRADPRFSADHVHDTSGVDLASWCTWTLRSSAVFQMVVVGVPTEAALPTTCHASTRPDRLRLRPLVDRRSLALRLLRNLPDEKGVTCARSCCARPPTSPRMALARSNA